MAHSYDWRVEASEQVVRDKWLDLRSDHCVMPDGTVVAPYYVLDYLDWANVVALTPEDELVMIRQYRHGIGRSILEIPCGRLDSKDDIPLKAARRELLEETGYACDDLRQTGTMWANASSHTNCGHTFVGTSARRVAEQQLDASEQIEVVLMPLAEVFAALDSGEVFPTSMHATLFFALRALGRISLD